MENKIKVKNIVSAGLFPRFFGALLDILMVVFVGAGVFIGLSSIARNIPPVNQHKETYIKSLTDSGLMTYNSSDDSFLAVTKEKPDDYETLIYDFYNGFYTSQKKDGILRDKYWFNVHVLGLEDKLSKYNSDSIPSYINTYGREHFTFKLDSDNSPLYNEFGLPKLYNNDPSNWDSLTASQKKTLNDYFYKSDEERSQIEESNTWRNFALFYCYSDLTSLEVVSNAYDNYAFLSSTLPLAISALLTIAIFYIVIPLFFKNGQTLGKKIMHICLVNKLGYQYKKVQLIPRVGFTALIMIALILFFGLNIISIGIATVLLFASYLCAIFSKTHIAFHDFFAGTLVVDERASTWFKDANEEAVAQRQVDDFVSKEKD